MAFISDVRLGGDNHSDIHHPWRSKLTTDQAADGRMDDGDGTWAPERVHPRKVSASCVRVSSGRIRVDELVLDGVDDAALLYFQGIFRLDAIPFIMPLKKCQGCK